jgi:hypothetical protein
VRARREADENHARSGVTESRHRFRPVLVIGEGALAHPPDLSAIAAQFGAAAASNDAPLERRQRRWHLPAFDCDGSRCLPALAMAE